MNSTEWQGANAFENEADEMLGGATKKPGAMALGGELVSILKEGVESGDADAGLPEEIGRMVSAGAGADELLNALRQAAEKGRISPLLLLKAEKALGAGPGADEMTDRSRVVRGNRNKLML